MVEPEEDGEQESKGDGDEDVGHGDIPEVDEPAPPWDSRHECGSRRQRFDLDFLHLAHVDEAGEENECQRRAVVLEEDAHRVLEQAALAKLATDVGNGEDQQGHDDGEIEGLSVAEHLEDLDALLQVDKGDVEAEDVAGEAGHVAQPVARVGDGEDPVEDERPSGISQCPNSSSGRE